MQPCCGYRSAALAADRPAAIKTFLGRSYNLDMLGGWNVSDQAWQNSFHVAVGVSAAAALGCAAARQEYFRADLGRIFVPVLVMQVSEDRIMSPAPARAAAVRLLAQKLNHVS